MPKRDLVITTIPGRIGLYLSIQEGSKITTLARFTKGQESANEFVDWCVKAGIKYEDMRKEGG